MTPSATYRARTAPRRGPARPDAPIERLDVAAYTVPTDAPESDGTLEWDSTTMVVVHAHAGGRVGLGYTYAHRAAGPIIEDALAAVVDGLDALSPPAANAAMTHAVRNNGQGGLIARAISAVDTALWDLKARLLDTPLVTLLGQVREAVDVYGSGGFTSYTVDRLRAQLAAWVEAGIPRVKMKIGHEPGKDPSRVAAARDAIGADAELFVDANGAYDQAQALGMARRFAEHAVTWFEEPLPSDDVAGLRALRGRVPPGMEIAAGEYADSPWAFRPLLDAVDVVQPDITRCGGLTALLDVAGLARIHHVPLSAHCAPALHLHPCCALEPFRHIEHFHDHARIERMLLDGLPEPRNGRLAPDLTRPGHGLELKAADADRYRV